MPSEPAILLAAFGSLQPSAFETYENIKRSYKREYPDSEVKISFTSDFIRRKLKQANITVPNPLAAMAELQDQGFRDIAIQPLQIVPGKEFHEIASLAQCLRGIRGRLGFERIALGMPLLASSADCRKTAHALGPIFEELIIVNGQKDRNKIEIVLAGHGTGHPADSLYSQMALILERSYKNILLGTLEGYPGLNDVLSSLKENKIERVIIVPFLLVAGGHVLDDIAGSEQSSWRSIIEREGIDVEVRLRGLGDEGAIVGLLIEHTSDAIKKDFIIERQ